MLELKEPEDTTSDDVISKAALVEYIRNRLAVLERSELYARQIELEDLLTHFDIKL